MFLSWEELPDEEQPPKRIWDDGKKLKEHFAEVKRVREARYGSDAIKDKHIDDERPNDAAKGLIAD